MKVSDLVRELMECMSENGDMDVVLMVDGKAYDEIELNCPDADSLLYVEGYESEVQ